MTDPVTASSAVLEINQRRARTITSIAVDAIEDMIISGELVAGDRINESTLADRLGISRGPIREACRSLEQAGLLVSQTNRGMYVREVSLDEARELYLLRGAVVGLAGELIVERATDDELQAMAAQVDKMQAAAEALDSEEYYKTNLQFHDGLISAARSRPLEEAYRKIVNQLHLLRRRGLVQEGNLMVSNAEHRAIIDALLLRDADQASQALRDHVSNGLDRLVASL